MSGTYTRQENCIIQNLARNTKRKKIVGESDYLHTGTASDKNGIPKHDLDDGRFLRSHEAQSDQPKWKIRKTNHSSSTLSFTEGRGNTSFDQETADALDRAKQAGKNYFSRKSQPADEEMDSEILDLSDTEVDKNQIGRLGNMKIKVLALNYSSFTDDSIGEALANLINNGLEELSLINSNISEDQLIMIANGLKRKVVLQVLDLSHVNVGNNGILAIARIVNKTKSMENLVLSDCNLTTQTLIILWQHVKNEIRALDLSSNSQIIDGDVTVLASLADKVESDELDISSNGLTSVQIKQLSAAKRPTNLQRLYISENPGIEPAAVCKLAKTWEIQSLDFSECRLNANAIAMLGECVNGRHKLQWLDISDPIGIVGEEKRKALKTLSKKVEKLLYANHEIFS